VEILDLASTRPIRLHGAVFNNLSTGTNLLLLFLYDKANALHQSMQASRQESYLPRHMITNVLDTKHGSFHLQCRDNTCYRSATMPQCFGKNWCIPTPPPSSAALNRHIGLRAGSAWRRLSAAGSKETRLVSACFRDEGGVSVPAIPHRMELGKTFCFSFPI
jgi:hypothetical protein